MATMRLPMIVKECLLAVAAFMLALLLLWQQRQWMRPGLPAVGNDNGLAADLDRCAYDRIRVETPKPPRHDRVNERATVEATFAIRNASVIDGDGRLVGLRDVLIRHGTIWQILPAGSATMEETDKDINLGGRYLSPGIIDMHSHLGVRSLPQYQASEDVGESGEPIAPQNFALDGFDPSDEAIERVRSGGVTTTLVLTGASSLISGQGFSLKLAVPASMSVTSMRIQSSGPKPQRYLKMACGENPKSRGHPSTRLGEASLMRDAFTKARRLLDDQDQWCEAVTRRPPTAGNARYPTDVALQPLVDVLRGDVRVNVHCYKTEDIEMILRLSRSAGFNLTALHHAQETWRMVEQLEPFRPLTLALFATEYGFKPETMRGSVNNAAIMHDAGFDIAVVSDHPALNGQHIIREAGVSHNFGLPAAAALRGLFEVPARAIGLDDRIGYVRPGYDADLVAWDDHPLQLGATPLQVWIDGEQQLTGGRRESTPAWDQARIGQGAPAQRGMVGGHTVSQCYEGAKTLVLHGIMSSLHPLKSFCANSECRARPPHTLQSAVVLEGRLVCIGNCHDDIAAALSLGAAVVNLTAGFLVPGLSTLTPMHGLTEMLMEPSTSDGFVDSLDFHPTFSKWGLAPAGIHVERANMVGISTIVTPPRARGPAVLTRIAGGGFIKGVSMAFHSGIKHAADGEVFVKEDVALHVTLGDAGKNEKVPTISKQVQTLRALLQTPIDDDWHRVSTGALPLAVHAESADVIAHAIRLRRDLPLLDMVIVGGAEAHLIAAELAVARIPVILSPWRCLQHTWEHRRCHPGLPLADESVVEKLLGAGVDLAIAPGDDRAVRDLWFEASWAVKAAALAHPHLGSSQQLAYELASRGIERILGLSVDHAKAFSVWEGDPFEYGAKPAVIFGRSQVERCWPSFE